ncbi:hypothetical protein Rmet_5475 (plasmid) [Cupriavidus metallidurans CH34]|uniref:Uncharacterized protein n=1 Tax=Cupriavidus metallidurans (strain ATCC 43123 / DSM 2839 / NBRC 102507 / CH34) TaxID=266264 RepID=Q1LBZ2_CUPMC|nr:hypothetical protein Rmet_5475 [Cupriavidus metallidurans CH34]
MRNENGIMGNNRLAANCHLPGDSPAENPTPGANGILGRIPSQYVSAAVNLLPPAASTTASHQEIELAAGPVGKVRFFAEKKLARHHRHSHYFWSVYRAEPVRTDDLL